MAEQSEMPKVKLGGQGLEVSRLGYGCMGLSGVYNDPLPEEEGIAVIQEAFNKGITFFDTSDLYGINHANEYLVGKSRRSSDPWEKMTEGTRYEFTIDEELEATIAEQLEQNTRSLTECIESFTKLEDETSRRFDEIMDMLRGLRNDIRTLGSPSENESEFPMMNLHPDCTIDDEQQAEEQQVEPCISTTPFAAAGILADSSYTTKLDEATRDISVVGRENETGSNVCNVLDKLTESFPAVLLKEQVYEPYAHHLFDEMPNLFSVNSDGEIYGKFSSSTTEGLESGHHLFDGMPEVASAVQEKRADVHEELVLPIVGLPRALSYGSEVIEVRSFNISSKLKFEEEFMLVDIKNHEFDDDYWGNGILMFIFDPGGCSFPRMGRDPFEFDGETGEFRLTTIVDTLVKTIKHKCRIPNAVFGTTVEYVSMLIRDDDLFSITNYMGRILNKGNHDEIYCNDGISHCQNDCFSNSFACEEIVMRYSLAKVYMVDLSFHQCDVYGKMLFLLAAHQITLLETWYNLDIVESILIVHDICIQGNHELYLLNDRMHARTAVSGFHKCEVNGSLLVLIAASSILPWVSLHSIDLVKPITPSITGAQVLQQLMFPMKAYGIMVLLKGEDSARHMVVGVVIIQGKKGKSLWSGGMNMKGIYAVHLYLGSNSTSSCMDHIAELIATMLTSSFTRTSMVFPHLGEWEPGQYMIPYILEDKDVLKRNGIGVLLAFKQEEELNGILTEIDLEINLRFKEEFYIPTIVVSIGWFLDSKGKDLGEFSVSSLRKSSGCLLKQNAVELIQIFHEFFIIDLDHLHTSIKECSTLEQLRNEVLTGVIKEAELQECNQIALAGWGSLLQMVPTDVSKVIEDALKDNAATMDTFAWDPGLVWVFQLVPFGVIEVNFQTFVWDPGLDWGFQFSTLRTRCSFRGGICHDMTFYYNFNCFFEFTYLATYDVI